MEEANKCKDVHKKAPQLAGLLQAVDSRSGQNCWTVIWQYWSASKAKIRDTWRRTLTSTVSWEWGISANFHHSVSDSKNQQQHLPFRISCQTDSYFICFYGDGCANALIWGTGLSTRTASFVIQGDFFGTRPKKMRISQRIFFRFWLHTLLHEKHVDSRADAGNVCHHCPGRAELDVSCLRKWPARRPH